jgi:hypothetical protein
VLSSGVEDQLPSVVLDVSLDAEGSVDLVLLPCRPMLAALCALSDIRSVWRGLWAGGRRSHALKIDPSSQSP